MATLLWYQMPKSGGFASSPSSSCGVVVVYNTPIGFNIETSYLIQISFYLYFRRHLCISIAGTGDCNFDDGWCGWTQLDEDNFDWSKGTGSTGTPHTGPQSDHTSHNGNK